MHIWYIFTVPFQVGSLLSSSVAYEQSQQANPLFCLKLDVTSDWISSQAVSNTTPEEFENVALFLQLGLTSTLIRHENWDFHKHSPDRRNLKTSAFCFRVGGKPFKNGAFRKRWLQYNLRRVFLKSKVIVEQKLLMRFQGETSVFNFHRRRVDRTLV